MRADDTTGNERAGRDAARLAESDAILRRIREETEPQIGARAARLTGSVSDHFSAADADPADRIEVWGTRIGRLAGLAGFAIFAALLAFQLAS